MSEYTSAYDSAENAEGAVSKLKLNGYSEDSITLSAPRSQNDYWRISVRAPFGMGAMAVYILEQFKPVTSFVRAERIRDPELDVISALSAPPPPGHISRREISRLSRPVAPGSISRLSRSSSSAAISRLSAPTSSAAIARLSSGWYLSFGLPLLLRSEASAAAKASPQMAPPRTMPRAG